MMSAVDGNFSVDALVAETFLWIREAILTGNYDFKF